MEACRTDGKQLRRTVGLWKHNSHIWPAVGSIHWICYYCSVTYPFIRCRRMHFASWKMGGNLQTLPGLVRICCLPAKVSNSETQGERTGATKVTVAQLRRRKLTLCLAALVLFAFNVTGATNDRSLVAYACPGIPCCQSWAPACRVSEVTATRLRESTKASLWSTPETSARWPNVWTPQKVLCSAVNAGVNDWKCTSCHTPLWRPTMLGPQMQASVGSTGGGFSSSDVG